MDRVRTAVIEELLTTAQLRFEAAELVWRAQCRYAQSKADFSDALLWSARWLRDAEES